MSWDRVALRMQDDGSHGSLFKLRKVEERLHGKKPGEKGRNSCAEGVRSAAFHVTFGVLFMHFSKMYLSRLYAVC